MAGILVQAALLAAALLALDVGRGVLLLLPGGATSLVALVAVLGPAWAGGFAAGWLGPPLRPRSLAAAGLPVAVCFFAITAGPVSGAWAPLLLRLWISGEMLFGFLLAGWIGRRFRPVRARRAPAGELPAPVTVGLKAGRLVG